MVVREGNVHDRARQYVLADNRRPLIDAVHTEDGGLRRVDNRRREQAAIYSAIGNREGPAGHIVDADRAITRLLAESVNTLQGIETRIAGPSNSRVQCLLKTALFSLAQGL